MNNITGKIHQINETAQVSPSFRKREFVLEYAENPEYPQYLSLQMVQDKCDILDNYQVGQKVEVSINLRGRKWTAPDGAVKYFNTLEAWRINLVEAQAPQPVAQQLYQPQGMPAAAAPVTQADDLPF